MINPLILVDQLSVVASEIWEEINQYPKLILTQCSLQTYWKEGALNFLNNIILNNNCASFFSIIINQ